MAASGQNVGRHALSRQRCWKEREQELEDQLKEPHEAGEEETPK